MRVIWPQRVLLDVEHIRDYIAQDSPAYPQPFVERVLHATRQLPQIPDGGRTMPEADDRRVGDVIYQGYHSLDVMND